MTKSPSSGPISQIEACGGNPVPDWIDEVPVFAPEQEAGETCQSKVSCVAGLTCEGSSVEHPEGACFDRMPRDGGLHPIEPCLVPAADASAPVPCDAAGHDCSGASGAWSCIAELEVCAQTRERDSDCPPRFVCDRRSALHAINGSEQFACVDPTCEHDQCVARLGRVRAI